MKVGDKVKFKNGNAHYTVIAVKGGKVTLQHCNGNKYTVANKGLVRAK